MNRRPRLVPILLTVCALLSPVSALALWSNDVTVNTPIVVHTAFKADVKILADGAGGAFVLWQDFRAGGSNADVYGQYFDPQGNERWTPGGRLLAGGPEYQAAAEGVLDGSGGLLLTYSQVENIAFPDEVNIYARRVDASGDPVWGPITVCNLPNAQLISHLVSDGAGGAILAWLDFRNTVNYDLYAQRINDTGTALWTSNGVEVRTATGDVQNFQMLADGLGGAYVAWADPRGGLLDIYLEHLNGSGAKRYGSDGTPVCDEAGTQTDVVVATDGQAGILLAWSDARTGVNDIFGQRFTPSGPQWPADGEPVIVFSGFQSTPTVVPDGDGGMFVAWTDARSANLEVRAQRMSRFGFSMWAPDGVVIASPGTQVPEAVSDNAGGFIAVFHDFRDPSLSLFAQRVNSSGSVQWGSGGVPVTRAPDYQDYFSVATDGRNGVLAVWEDFRRDGNTGDFYGQRVEGFGFAGVPEPRIESAVDVPNDQGGKVRLQWYGSWPEMPPSNAIDYYNLFRSVPGGLAAQRRAAGARMVTGAGTCASGDCLLATVFSGQTFFWEYVGTQSGFDLPAYSFVMPTTSDSVAGSNPLTRFMVQARSYTGPQYWNSEPDSGYSTDDLAPATPSPFAGVYAAGSATLNWGANTEADLAGYRLHRGVGPGFVPSEANLVAATTETNHVDEAGSPFLYKLAAVDEHGNLSGYALLVPQGIVDAARPSLPREISLGPVAPNPAFGVATLRFALPSEERVRLSIFDAQGRAVRVVADGAWPAGEHALRWDGRNTAGEAAGVGLYLARLEAGGHVRITRFTLLR